MNRTIEGAPGIRSGAIPDPVAEAWAALRNHLESRARELNEEVRNYPSPIARCDVQLTKLIEQRTHTINQLNLMSSVEAKHPAHPARALFREFASACANGDDEVEMAILSRLRAAVSASPEGG